MTPGTQEETIVSSSVAAGVEVPTLEGGKVLMEVGTRYNAWRLVLGSFIPNWLMSRTEVTSSAKLLFARLAQHGGKKGWCIPSQKLLADELGLSRRSVQNLLRELITHRLVQVLEREGSSNQYIFLVHNWMGQDAQSFPESPEEGTKQTAQVDTQHDTQGVRRRLRTKRINEETHGKEVVVSEKVLPQKRVSENDLPSYISKELWNEFREHRREKRKPITYHNELRLLERLGKLSGGNAERAAEMVIQAIECGWLQFFPLKQNGRDTPQRTQPSSELKKLSPLQEHFREKKPDE